MKLLRSLGVVCLSALVFLISDIVIAFEHPLASMGRSGQLIPVMHVLEDVDHAFDEVSIRQQDEQRWQALNDRAPSFGFSRSTYWARFSYQNTSDRAAPLYVEVGYPLLTEVTLYQVEKTIAVSDLSHAKMLDITSTDTIGNGFPFNERRIQHRNLVFPVNVTANSFNTFYLKIHSQGAIQFPVVLWQPEQFYAQDQYQIFQHGAYYGLVFVMVLYNLFLFWQFRDRVYLLYVLYVSTFATTQLALTGFAYQLLWPTLPWWNQISIAVVTPTIVMLGCVFVRQALKLHEHARHLCRLINGMAMTGSVLIIASLLFPYQTMIKLVAALVIVACGLALYASYYVWLHRKQRFAAYFSFAWSVFLFGVVCLALNKFGIIPRNFFTESAAQIGSAIEIILLSYALAERLRAASQQRLQAETEARAANEKLLVVQQDITSELEKKYFLKTRELEDALEKVHVLNAELTELSHTDQLTGVRNRRFLDVFLAREVKRAQRYKQPLSLIMIDIDHFKSVNDQFGHPVGDFCLKRVTQAIMASLRRSQDEVCRYGGEELAVILPDTTMQGAFHRAEVIRAAVENMLIETGDAQLRVTISLGVSSTEKGTASDPLALTTHADKALYSAKRLGRNRTCAYAVMPTNPYANVHWLHKRTD